MAEEKKGGFLTNLLGGFLGGDSEMAGPSISAYNKAVDKLEAAGYSPEDILDVLGPPPELITDRADGGRIGFQDGGMEREL